MKVGGAMWQGRLDEGASVSSRMHTRVCVHTYTHACTHARTYTHARTHAHSQCATLIKECKFPWLMANVREKETGSSSATVLAVLCARTVLDGGG